MFNFWRKNNDQQSYESITNRIADFVVENRVLSQKVASIQTEIDELRGRFNRKLKGLQAEEVKEEPKTQDLNRFSPFL